MLGLGRLLFPHTSLVLHVPVQPGSINSIHQTNVQRDKDEKTCPNPRYKLTGQFLQDLPDRKQHLWFRSDPFISYFEIKWTFIF